MDRDGISPPLPFPAGGTRFPLDNCIFSDYNMCIERGGSISREKSPNDPRLEHALSTAFLSIQVVDDEQGFPVIPETRRLVLAVIRVN
jgi:hypothetical protein